MQRLFLMPLVVALLSAISARAANETNYTMAECRGSASLYPANVQTVAVPDSLTPVFINHVGRHGARFPASAKNIRTMMEALESAQEAATITPLGTSLMELCRRINGTVAGQWGALDSIGMAEQRGIASRMVKNYPRLIDNGRIEAISSYAPRCIMSMYTFMHQVSRLNNKVELTTSSGRRYSYLLRPFDVDAEYLDYREGDKWKQKYDAYESAVVTLEPLKRVLGDISGYTPEDARKLAMLEYQIVADAAAAGVSVDAEQYFSRAEFNSLWQAFNMRQYLRYAANICSTIPADMAAPLLENLINSTQAVVDGDRTMPTVMLRFGHAETLMPLLSLIKLKGCYYVTNYLETVPQHWCDFNIVPMGANLQMVLLKSKKGRYYLRVDLNEKPVPLIPGSDAIYIPWSTAHDYLTRCIPFF